MNGKIMTKENGKSDLPESIRAMQLARNFFDSIEDYEKPVNQAICEQALIQAMKWLEIYSPCKCEVKL